MALLNRKLDDSFLAGELETPDADGAIDTAQVIDELVWSLHAETRADLYPWSQADLMQWIDEAVKRLAAVACVFVGRDVNTLTVAGQATYALPPRHVSTLHVSIGTDAIRPANTAEMEARDPAYQITQGAPDSWYQDLLGMASLGLAPVPNTADVPIAQIYEGWPEPMDLGQTMLTAPPPIKGYLAMAVLAEAYGREGEMEMPDVAAHCRGRLDLYHSLLQHYYGAGR